MASREADDDKNHLLISAAILSVCTIGASAQTKWYKFDKKFIEQRKIFLWGVVDDKSSKDITARLLYLEALDQERNIRREYRK